MAFKIARKTSELILNFRDCPFRIALMPLGFGHGIVGLGLDLLALAGHPFHHPAHKQIGNTSDPNKAQQRPGNNCQQHSNFAQANTGDENDEHQHRGTHLEHHRPHRIVFVFLLALMIEKSRADKQRRDAHHG